MDSIVWCRDLTIIDYKHLIDSYSFDSLQRVLVDTTCCHVAYKLLYAIYYKLEYKRIAHLNTYIMSIDVTYRYIVFRQFIKELIKFEKLLHSHLTDVIDMFTNFPVDINEFIDNVPELITEVKLHNDISLIKLFKTLTSTMFNKYIDKINLKIASYHNMNDVIFVLITKKLYNIAIKFIKINNITNILVKKKSSLVSTLPTLTINNSSPDLDKLVDVICSLPIKKNYIYRVVCHMLLKNCPLRYIKQHIIINEKTATQLFNELLVWLYYQKIDDTILIEDNDYVYDILSLVDLQTKQLYHDQIKQLLVTNMPYHMYKDLFSKYISKCMLYDDITEYVTKQVINRTNKHTYDMNILILDENFVQHF